MRLTPLDCRILDLLDRDARLSADEIARKLRVSGDSVLYHLAKLKDEKVLGWSGAMIDFWRLGLILFRISIKLSRNTAIESLAKKLFNIPGITLVVETRGEHDLIVWGVAENLKKASEAYSSANELLGSLTQTMSLELITETSSYSRGFLVNRPGKVFPARGDAGTLKLDKIEIEILKKVREDARKPATIIALELDTTPAIVSYRIKKLETSGVITGYRVNLNSEKLGLQRFRAQISFHSGYNECKSALRKFAEKTPSVTRLEFHIGGWPAELGLEIESFTKLHEALDETRSLADNGLQINGIALFRQSISAPASNWDKILMQLASN